ncbi:MAG: hypothetical protein DME08_07095 [Candidatus Rokuibacteriota bacterium]|nr:MAG: hypothetical protein DME08_07095 [Candidatus Rokubacteria bacterium]
MTQALDHLEWALQRRLEDVFAKLGEKYGDLTGRVEMAIRPTVTFEEIGGLTQAKETLRGFATALSTPERYREWGIAPPKGLLLYGPPGTGKAMLARALASAAEAIFYHLKLVNLTSKFAANTAELLQEVLRIAVGEGRGVLLLDEVDALSLDHLLAPPQAREASARLIAALGEKLDAMDPSRLLVVGATSRTDALDPALVAPGRLDHLSGADIKEILRRALEAKVRQTVRDGSAPLVTTTDLLEAMEGYKRVRGVVEKIRYGQYL